MSRPGYAPDANGWPPTRVDPHMATAGKALSDRRAAIEQGEADCLNSGDARLRPPEKPRRRISEKAGLRFDRQLVEFVIGGRLAIRSRCSAGPLPKTFDFPGR